MIMKNILTVLSCFLFSISLVPEGIYGTYLYLPMFRTGSAISILEDGTYQFIYRAGGFGPKDLSEGIWEYIGDDKYLIKTLYNHNSIPMDVVEKSTGGDSLIFVITETVGSIPPKLYIDNNIYYFQPRQNTLMISKTAIKEGSVFYIKSEIDLDKIGPEARHSCIKSIGYRISNLETDLYEIFFPVRTPFKDFFDYHYLEERNDTIEIRNGELVLDSMTHILAPGRSLPDW